MIDCYKFQLDCTILPCTVNIMKKMNGKLKTNKTLG